MHNAPAGCVLGTQGRGGLCTKQEENNESKLYSTQHLRRTLRINPPSREILHHHLRHPPSFGFGLASTRSRSKRSHLCPPRLLAKAMVVSERTLCRCSSETDPSLCHPLGCGLEAGGCKRNIWYPGICVRHSPQVRGSTFFLHKVHVVCVSKKTVLACFFAEPLTMNVMMTTWARKRAK